MAQTEVANDVKIEDIGPCLKKITITIPAEKVSEQMESSLAMVSMEAQLPGFRPGRAPKRLIQKKFGSVIESEARNQLVSSAYAEAIEENKLRVIGEPDGSAMKDLEVEAGQPVKVELQVEVAPEFELPELDGIEVKKPLIEVTDARVEDQLERVKNNEGSLEPQDKAELGDYCIGHGVLKDESGEVVLDLPGAVIQVPKEKDGSGLILGVKVDDFGKQIGKPKAGDELTVKAVGPENHERVAVRGKPVEINFTVEQVQRIIPASEEDLVKNFGFEDVDQLKQSLKMRLEQRVMVEQQTAMRQQIARHLLDNIEFELPEKLTEGQASRNIQRAQMEMQYRGMDENTIEERVAEMRSSSKEVAQRELKLFFILNKVAQDMEVQVTEEEVYGRIAQMAAERGERPDELRQRLIRSNQINTLAQQVREHKAMDTILNKAKVEELDLEAYNKHFAKTEGVSEIDADKAE